MKDIIFKEIKIFENYELLVSEEGHVILQTVVVEGSLNHYGNGHGGYLYTLCDSVAGLAARNTGAEIVTMGANMHYLKAAHLGDTLTVEGNCIHNGRTTKVIEVEIKNQEEKLLCKGTFTMFAVKERIDA